eukprot:6430736-Amphidinium_carterae.2
MPDGQLHACERTALWDVQCGGLYRTRSAFAKHQLMLNCMLPAIVTDSQATLDLIAQGRTKGLRAQQPRAHLLRQGAVAQHVPRVHWIRNSMADKLAGEAARSHTRAKKAPELLALEAKLKEIAQCAAIQVESAMGDPWQDNDGPPREAVPASLAIASEQPLAPTWLGGLVDAAKQSVEDFLRSPKGKSKERRVHQQEGVAATAPLEEVDNQCHSISGRESTLPMGSLLMASWSRSGESAHYGCAGIAGDTVQAG